MGLKEKLAGGTITVGSWITMGHPEVAEIMARAGFDWLTVDLEHSAITLSQAQQLIAIIELSGVFPLVRVGKNEPDLIKRVMDAGAHGVIVPMVNSEEDAKRAVSAVKYPPEGERGVGLSRAQGYGAEFEKYKEWNLSESVVIVQIEHIQAVENLEHILSVEGVDGFIVGPYDLSGSLGVPGDFDNADVLSALNRIKEVSKKMKPASGFHSVSSDPNEAAAKIEEGYTFIGFSLDILFLGDLARTGLRRIRHTVP
jgi:2-dehydro-3-deoxyglucarate aldolase